MPKYNDGAFYHLLLEDIYFKSLCILNSFLAHIHLVNFLIFNLKLLRQFITRNNNIKELLKNKFAVTGWSGVSIQHA